MKSLSEVITEHKYLIDLNKIHHTFNRYFDKFNVDDVPLKDRKQLLVNFEELHYDFENSFEFPEPKLIFEHKSDKPYPAIYVINQLKKKYKFTDYCFKVVSPNNVDFLKINKIPNYLCITNSIFVPVVCNNVKMIEEELTHYGYYKVSERSYHDDKTNSDWVQLEFDPVVQESITKQILRTIDSLYHFSPASNAKSIEDNGIVPHNDKRVYDYNSKRVYLFASGNRIDEVNDMLAKVSKNRHRNDNTFDGKYLIYRIDTDKLPRDIQLYWDPHGKDCVYTNTTIKYDWIDKIKEVNVKLMW